MILISRRKMSPGTSQIGEAVNKVTCFAHRLARSSRWGPCVAGRAERGSLTPRRGGPGRGQKPCVCFLRGDDLLEGWDCFCLLCFSPPSAFLPRPPSHLSTLSSSSPPPKWQVPLLHLASRGSAPLLVLRSLRAVAEVW